MASVLLLALLSLGVRDISVDADGTQPVHVSCPLDRSLRIVLPEALLRMRTAGENARLDVVVEQTRPLGIVVVTPHAYPLRTTLDVRGATRGLSIAIESAPAGPAVADVRLTFPGAPAPAAPVTTTAPPLPSPPTPAPTVAATPAPASTTAAPPASAGPDAAELLRARVIVAGDREALPGQPAMILTDVLQGERSVWLRFLLERGAGSHVARVAWEGGTITDVTQEDQGRDLRVIARVDPAALTRRAHVTLDIEGGATYTFGLDTRPLRELFR